MLNFCPAADAEQQGPVLATLQNLAADAANHPKMSQLGAIKKVLPLCLSTSERVQQHAAALLFNLVCKGGDRFLNRPEAWDALMHLLKAESASTRAKAAQLSDALARYEANWQPMGDAGVIPYLASMLADSSETTNVAALTALSRLAKNEGNRARIAAACNIPHLLSLMQSALDSVQLASSAIVMELAKEKSTHNILIQADVLTALQAPLRSSKQFVQRNAAAAIFFLVANPTTSRGQLEQLADILIKPSFQPRSTETQFLSAMIVWHLVREGVQLANPAQAAANPKPAPAIPPSSLREVCNSMWSTAEAWM